MATRRIHSNDETGFPINTKKEQRSRTMTTNQTVLENLRTAFPADYVRSTGRDKNHKIDFERWGATIYIRPSTPNIARIRVQAIELGSLPNSGRLRTYAEDESSGVYRHTTKGRDEYQFGQQHVSELIRILRG